MIGVQNQIHTVEVAPVYVSKRSSYDCSDGEASLPDSVILRSNGSHHNFRQIHHSTFFP